MGLSASCLMSSLIKPKPKAGVDLPDQVPQIVVAQAGVTKLDEILDAIKPLESEAMAAVSAGSATTETQKARLQELLTQKMLQLDSVEVQGSDGREKRNSPA